MLWSDISFDPPKRKLRQFAGLWFLFLGGWSVWLGLVREQTTPALIAAGLALAVGPLGLLLPRTLRWLYVGWMIAAFPVGWVISHILLAVVYFGLFWPIAVVFRLMGRDALSLKPSAKESYWQPKESPRPAASYFRQF